MLTPAIMAVQEGDVDMVKTLVAGRADLEKAAANGATPILMASQEVKFLNFENLKSKTLKS